MEEASSPPLYADGCSQCANPNVKYHSFVHLRPYCSVACMQHAKEEPYFAENIEKLTLQNEQKGPVIFYRDPAGHVEIGAMTVQKGDTVKVEEHKQATQFFRVEQGYGEVRFPEFDRSVDVSPGSSVIVPAGTWHEIRAKSLLRFYTIYAKDVDGEWPH